MQHRLIQVELDLKLRSSCPALSDKVKEGGVARSIDQCMLHGAPVQHQKGVNDCATFSIIFAVHILFIGDKLKAVKLILIKAKYGNIFLATCLKVRDSENFTPEYCY